MDNYNNQIWVIFARCVVGCWRVCSGWKDLHRDGSDQAARQGSGPGLSLYNYMEHSIANLIALISTLMLERSSLGLLVDLLHLVHILGT